MQITIPIYEKENHNKEQLICYVIETDFIRFREIGQRNVRISVLFHIDTK